MQFRSLAVAFVVAVCFALHSNGEREREREREKENDECGQHSHLKHLLGR